PTGICYNIPGSYTVALIASNANGSDTLTLTNYITVYPNSPPQSIQQSGDTLTSNTGILTYQWFYYGDSIAGATNNFYVAVQSGDYNVICTDSNGCEVEAGIVNVVAATGFEVSGLRFEVFPNPVDEKLEIRNLKLGTAATISIYNSVGEKAFTAVHCQPETINCKQLECGLYVIEIKSNGETFRSKFIKQ